MADRADKTGQFIDPLTSASIRRAIGEKLSQSLMPEPSSLPSHLEELLDEMRRQESLASHNGHRTVIR
jgi:hypothetical protein